MADTLAFWNMLENGVFDVYLSQSSFDDCQHIAAAVALECGCIVSWNFKHLVNIKTIRGVRELTNSDGKKVLDIRLAA